MNKFFKSLVAAAALALPMMASAATEPTITLTSSMYEQNVTGTFTILLGTSTPSYVDVDCGYGTVEYETQPVAYDPDTEGFTGTYITCQASANGVVKIYADDPSLIDYFQCVGGYVETVDLSKCPNIQILDLQHNALKTLDISMLNKLAAVYLSDNPFTANTPLTIGANHPGLQILEVAMVDYIDPNFDICNFPNLLTFDGYACRTLKKLTPSGCPKLMRLACDLSQVSELDVTQNPELLILNIEDTRITSIDVTKNTKLQQLYTSHFSGTVNNDVKLNELDITHNPDLIYFTASNNNLREIDITKNPALQYVLLQNNHLQTIDITNNQYLVTFKLAGNDLSYATIPFPNERQWNDYDYRPRNLNLGARSFAEGTVFDLSDKLLREGTSTAVRMYSYDFVNDESKELSSDYYTYDNGRITVLKECADSVYLAFSNSAFPDGDYCTERFMVKTAESMSKPSARVSFTTSVSSGTEITLCLRVAGASDENSRTVYVDFGDGTLVPFTITRSDVSTICTGTRAGYGKVTVYTEGDDVLTAFEAYSVPMYALDVTKATELQILVADKCNLSSVNLAYNRCLQCLDLTGNKLTKVDLTGVNEMYTKNLLNVIRLSDNQISDLTLNPTLAINELCLANNRLTEFKEKDFDNMGYFDISGNQLEFVNVSYMTLATYINVSNNNLTSINLPLENNLYTLNLSGNNFTIETLPLYTCTRDDNGYIYAPQRDLQIPTRGPGFNLTAQNRVIDGQSTVFTWKKEDGTELTADQYTCEGGLTRFLDTTVGRVYCEMTHPALPQFAGEKAFRTTLMMADEKPTNLVASFTTPVGGQNVTLSLASPGTGVALYVDWTGQDVYEQYMLKSTYTLFTAETAEGVNVKCYTYEPTEQLSTFSISNATMTDVDLSGLTNVSTLTIKDAAAESIIFPAQHKIFELDLSGNSFTSFDGTQFPDLVALSMINNNLTKVDLSNNKQLQVCNLAENFITEVTFDNPSLWMLSLADNELSEIDFTGAPNISQLALNYNHLSNVDFSKLPNLIQLLIDHNRMRFSTLPYPSEKLISYIYANQENIDANPVDGRVDLSSEAVVYDTPTTFHWFLGEPSYDDYGNLTGEELYGNDDEYYLENGVTAFNADFKNVVGVLMNDVFPYLYLVTNPFDVTKASQIDANVDLSEATVTVDGRTVVLTATAADGTPAYFYTVDGRLAGEATFTSGQARITNLPAGAGVVLIGTQGTKVVIR